MLHLLSLQLEPNLMLLATHMNVENVVGTSEDDFIAGNDGDNVIDGGDGADNLNGWG